MRVLAFDPGATTGYAALANGGGRLILEAAGVITYRREQTGGDIWAIIRAHTPTLIVVEDWENQGRRVNIHSAWPNRVIGQVEAYANLLGIHLSHVGAGTWKPSFAARANLLRYTLPVRLDQPHERIGKRLMLELGGWPECLAGAPADTLRHAVDAAGLACWVALTPRLHGIC